MFKSLLCERLKSRPESPCPGNAITVPTSKRQLAPKDPSDFAGRSRWYENRAFSSRSNKTSQAPHATSPTHLLCSHQNWVCGHPPTIPLDPLPHRHTHTHKRKAVGSTWCERAAGPPGKNQHLSKQELQNRKVTKIEYIMSLFHPYRCVAGWRSVNLQVVGGQRTHNMSPGGCHTPRGR